MIYTRFGSPCKIVGKTGELGIVDIEYTAPSRFAKRRRLHVSELRADDGSKEICQAMEAAPLEKEAA